MGKLAGAAGPVTIRRRHPAWRGGGWAKPMLSHRGEAMNVYETLMLAADAVESAGWVKGANGWGGDGGLCLEGAIAAAAGLEVTDYDPETGREIPPIMAINTCPAGVAVRDYLGLGEVEFTGPGNALWRWNDRVAESAERVVEVLRATAATSLTKDAAFAAREHAAEGVSA